MEQRPWCQATGLWWFIRRDDRELIHSYNTGDVVVEDTSVLSCASQPVFSVDGAVNLETNRRRSTLKTTVKPVELVDSGLHYIFK